MIKFKRRSLFPVAFILLVATIPNPLRYLIKKIFKKGKSTMPQRILITPFPLQIGTGDQNSKSYYSLPSKTKLHHIATEEDGQELYRVFFYHQGTLSFEDEPSDSTTFGSNNNPLPLSDIDPSEVIERFSRFPLSKEDILAAVKANKISKANLIDIYNKFSKEPYHKR